MIIERKKMHGFHRTLLYHDLISKTYPYVVHPIQIYTYTHTHTSIHPYIYIYIYNWLIFNKDDYFLSIYGQFVSVKWYLLHIDKSNRVEKKIFKFTHVLKYETPHSDIIT